MLEGQGIINNEGMLEGQGIINNEGMVRVRV